ncbi:TonB-dependent receptor [Rhodanobacter glycinis]|uniref:TonB-dependent receptor n=1 Tax=Rhodanobacter glycinis TaxID=582702 RepID=A0A5B9DW79_9GAMM|nr:TonB-dependent receptor [Rhodanobacter glycinis]QEE23384.1 TonB-dependent receptor [Rhodanobacter glycinis]
MTSFHASRMRKCLLAAAVSQALIVLPVAAQTESGTRNPSEKHQADASKPVKLEVVTVTAQRRSQNLQAVPVSVTALNEVQLNERGISNAGDLNGAAPSLVVAPAPGGDSTVASFAMRGTISGLNHALYADTPISLYVDGVDIGKTAGNVFELLNLERVEVLRGPQGTLFGRNTMAGAINLITRPPSGVFTGDATVGIGNYGSKVGKVAMDLPAIGKLKASLGARVERRDGWVKTTPGSSTSQFGNKHSESAYGTLRYDATDNLTIDYRYDYSHIDQSPLFNQAIYSDVGTVFHIPGIEVSKDRQDRASVNAPSYDRVKIQGNALHATWKLGDVGTLKYIGAYREMHFENGLDLDGSPVAFAQSQEHARYHQISHELQYLGSYGRWDWVTGLYFYEDAGFTYDPQQYFLGQVNYLDNYGYATQSRAAYAQVDYKLTDRWTLTAGLRRSNEKKRTDVFLQMVPYPPIVPAGTAAKASFGATTPALTLSFQATPTNMVYARYAKGYLSGGFNGSAQTVISATTPFKPESQQTYEIGTKNTLLDDKLSLNADIYYNRVSNLQQQVFTANGAAGTVILNVGDSHSQGFELEAHLHPTEDFTMGLNYAYLHAKFDKFMVIGQDVAKNRSYQFAPRNTASLVLSDVLARTSHGVLKGTLDYRYTSKYYEYVYPFTPATPPSALAGNNVIRENGILNAKLSFSDMNWGHGIDGEISLWVKNLTNKAHIDNLIDFGPNFGNLRVANFNEPRTFGVNFTARW